MPKVVEVVLKMVNVVLYMLEAVNGARCVLWVLGFMLCVLFCILFCMVVFMLHYILEAVEADLRLLEVLRC